MTEKKIKLILTNFNNFNLKCLGSACNVYVLVLGENNSDGIVSTDGATTVTANSQVDPTTSNFYPVNQNNRFPIVTSASCNGCNVPKSC